MARTPQPLARAAQRLYGGTDKNLATADATSPAVRTAQQTGVPVSTRRIESEVSADSFTLPGGGAPVNRSKLNAFVTIVRDFERQIGGHPQDAKVATRAMAQRLLDMHAEEMRGVHEHYSLPHAEQFARVRKAWRDEVAGDAELGKNQHDTSIKRLKALLEQYGAAKGAPRLAALRQLFAATGVGDNIEFLRFVSWIEGRVRASSQHTPAEMPRGAGAVQAGGRR